MKAKIIKSNLIILLIPNIYIFCQHFLQGSDNEMSFLKRPQIDKQKHLMYAGNVKNKNPKSNLLICMVLSN